MIHVDPLKNKPALLKCLTGLSMEGFMALLAEFEVAYEVDVVKRDSQRNAPRRRNHGAGQKGALPKVADKLVFILFYGRLYPVQLAQGFFFGMGQPQANDWIHRLSPVLQAALGYDLQLPARPPQDIKAVLETCPGLEFIIDGTERPIRRPQDKVRQKAHYSGKKKRHTVKNNVITDKATGKIEGLSPLSRASATTKSWRMSSRWIFLKAANSGKRQVFKAMNQRIPKPFNPPRNPKGANYRQKKKVGIRPLLKSALRLNILSAESKSFELCMMFFATGGRALMIWSSRLLAVCTISDLTIP